MIILVMAVFVALLLLAVCKAHTESLPANTGRSEAYKRIQTELWANNGKKARRYFFIGKGE